MVVFPHCKINLGLRVVSKRADGYHNIETCFYPVGVTDVLEIVLSQEFSFTQSGLVVPGNTDQNLCVKAYQLLQNDFPIGNVKIHVHKIIPMGAGLGGGSADGAFTLRLLNQLFALNISDTEMRRYASRLGSDCSFFMQDSVMMGRSRGDELSPASVALKNYFLVLVKPNVHISTAAAYAAIEPAGTANNLDEILKMPIRQWKDYLFNDFEKGIFTTHPQIGSLKEKLYSLGAIYAAMSGSGASVYGLFEKPVNLKKEFEACFYWGGVLN